MRAEKQNKEDARTAEDPASCESQEIFSEETFLRLFSRPVTNKGGFYRAQSPIVGVSRYCPCLRERLHCHESTERSQTTGTKLLWAAI
jgi:hypothetical protein